jgi:hypothetical protein
MLHPATYHGRRVIGCRDHPVGAVVRARIRTSVLDDPCHTVDDGDGTQRGANVAVEGLRHRVSTSTESALRWAIATARHRTAGAMETDYVGPADLLVGAILAHADADGEVAVLLTHFGLTARDVLPDDYPPIRPQDLERWAVGLPDDLASTLASDSRMLFDRAASSSRDGLVQLPGLIGAFLTSGSTLETAFLDAFRRAGADGVSISKTYDEWWLEESRGDHTARTGFGGTRLRERLLREHPRRPVQLPDYLPDREEQGYDLLGIGAEVDAFAYLLASRAMQPPLAIGLFGDWGSGKSFFMRAVRRRVEQITREVADRPQPDVPFWKQIRQIDFNAWQYVRGELWASLADHIFRELGPQEEVGWAKSIRGAVEQERLAAEAAQKQEQEQQRELTERRNEVEQRLAAAEQKRKAKADEVSAARKQLIEETQREQAQRVLEEVLGQGTARLLDGRVEELQGALAAARQELIRGRVLLGPYWTRTRIATATLIAFLIPAVVALLDRLGTVGPVSAGGGLAAAVAAATAGLRSASNWTRQRLDDVAAAQAAIDTRLATELRPFEAEVARIGEELNRINADLQANEAGLHEAARKRDAAVEKLEQLTPARILADFLAQRSSGEEYRPYLGLLSVVREHLLELEGLIREHNADAAQGQTDEDAQVNRIILYIDDLDRCSTAKVVEVLEAVHLLLAFEPFVVVVAVDERWLTHALTDEFPSLVSGAVTGDRATPHDYLEKIFQLPFWVEPLDDGARRRLLRRLLEGSVRPTDDGSAATQPVERLDLDDRRVAMLEELVSRSGSEPWIEARQATLTADDLRLVEELAPLLGDTPRRVKRFVNTYQLVGAMLDGSPPEEIPDRAIVAFLASTQDGVPEVSEALFAALDADSVGTLGLVVSGLDGRAPEQQLERLRDWLADHPSWNGLPVERLRGQLPMIRRLSFAYVPPRTYP